MNATQSHAADILRTALITLGVDTKVYPAGQGSMEPYDGAFIGFENPDRTVHCYRDDDGTWMIDAMQCDIGSPSPAPYRIGLLIAYIEWAQGQSDDAFNGLAEASKID